MRRENVQVTGSNPEVHVGTLSLWYSGTLLASGSENVVVGLLSSSNRAAQTIALLSHRLLTRTLYCALTLLLLLLLLSAVTDVSP